MVTNKSKIMSCGNNLHIIIMATGNIGVFMNEIDKIYKITPDGVIYRRPYINCKGEMTQEKELKQSRHSRGYSKVSLRVGGRTFTRTVHSLVAEKHIGPRPDGYDIDHKNMNKKDNRVENLEYVSHAENIRRKPKNEFNTSKFRGVYFDKIINKYRASKKAFGKVIYLGCFEVEEDAYEAFLEFEKKIELMADKP